MRYKIHTHYKKVLADLYTPVAIYNKLRDQFSNALLLESADYHDRTDSKSFICLDPIAGFEAMGKKYHYEFPTEDSVHKTAGQPKEVFESFKSFVGQFEQTSNDLPFNIQGLWDILRLNRCNIWKTLNLLFTKVNSRITPI